MRHDGASNRVLRLTADHEDARGGVAQLFEAEAEGAGILFGVGNRAVGCVVAANDISDGAALYDEDVRKQAMQLGIAGWK